MKKSLSVVLLGLLLTLSAPAARIQSVVQDQENDQLIIEVLFDGTNSNHHFELTWGQCLPLNKEHIPYQTEAHLDDLDGDDQASEEQVQTLYFSLKDMNCRPSEATIRLNRFSHSTLIIE